MNVAVSYTPREQIEVHRFSLAATIGIPLMALFAQAFIPARLPFFSILDLPLLVAIFFAVARRNPVAGLLTGSLIGIFQDSLTHHPLGLYGIAKTVVGYGASSLGAKVDVDNPGSRLLLTLFFYLVHQAIYFTVARHMAQEALEWQWAHLLGAAFVNGVVAVILFALLDRAKQRA